MVKKELGLGIYGLDAHDEVWIRSVFRVTSSRLQHRWVEVDPDSADVLLCRPGSIPQTGHSDHQTVIVLVLHHSEQPVPGTLVLRAPLRSKNFIETLQHCAELLHSGSDVTKDAAARRAAETSTEGLLLPQSMDWLRDLHQILVMGRNAAILVEGRHRYTVYHSTRRLHYVDTRASIISADHLVYAWSQDALSDYFGWQTVPLDRVSPERLDGHAELSPVVPANMPAWPLEQLLWKLGGLLSRQALLPAASLQKAYQFYRWPDFGAIGDYNGNFLLSAALTHGSYSLSELRLLTDLPIEQIQGVLHCALCCNLLLESEATQRTADEAALLMGANADVPRAHGVARVLSVIRQALGLRAG